MKTMQHVTDFNFCDPLHILEMAIVMSPMCAVCAMHLKQPSPSYFGLLLVIRY